MDDGQKSEKQVILCLLLGDTSCYKADNSADTILHNNKKMFLFFIKYCPTHVSSYYQ